MILLSLICIRTSSFSERNNEFYNRMISSSSGNNPVHFRAHQMPKINMVIIQETEANDNNVLYQGCLNSSPFLKVLNMLNVSLMVYIIDIIRMKTITNFIITNFLLSKYTKKVHQKQIQRTFLIVSLFHSISF